MTKEENRYPDQPDVSTHMYPYWFKFAMFYILGVGPNWVMPTALAQEIPYFENNLPEGISIAAYMNAATSSSLVVVLLYYGYVEYIRPIPNTVSVPVLLCTSLLSAWLSLAIYDIVAGKVSICLYLCCFIAGCVGALSQVIMNPFMTNYENDFISAARSGGSGTILLIAFIAMGQDPGSDNPTFPPRIFFLIFGILLIMPLIAYRFIILKGLGLKPKVKTISSKSPQLALVTIDEEQTNGSAINPLQKESGGDGAADSKNNTAKSSNASENGIVYTPDITDKTALDFIGRTCAQFITRNFLEGRVSDEKIRWYEVLIPYMLCVAWINFNTWGLMTAFIPFAIDYATRDGNGSESLALAYQLSALALFLGDLSTTQFKLPISFAICVFTICSSTVNSAAFSTNEENFDKPGIVGLIVFFVVLGRFLEAHMLTSTYRIIATNFPPYLREECSRQIGLVDQISTTIGTCLSTAIVAAARR